ncbi:PAC2 family-domain-containing protein [Radiomyces spectabilis]|uniref:PAC2 family-domain-containing protein n=1 Tax=Radiomyces spectabilis TaxID=64574 RepID=UPI00221F0270|nr:PAC2 family-domain-containing protein [Radiomyces spectabilis]KAI8372924.1 PAC2 family-domain-containing protein [Radiomyces spectabilis]
MNPFIPTSAFDPNHLKGSTLILPSVSIGNVPQLACDLFIHTIKLERVGFIEDNAVMPMVGAREGTDATGVSVSVEVYQSSCRQWTVVQQRAPAFKGKRRQYIDHLATFIQQAEFSNVVLLTSADAARRMDSQINGPPFRVQGSATNTFAQRAFDLGVQELEKIDINDTAMDQNANALPGTKFAQQLFQKLQELSIPTTLFIMFALEGDNVNDGVAFANLINAVLQLKPASASAAWTPPKSWEFLFGTPFNAGLYQ